MADTIDTKLVLDAREALKALVELQKKGNETSKKLGDDFKAVKFSAVTSLAKDALNAAQNLANLFARPIREAIQFEDTVQGLNVALKLSGITSKLATKEILAFAEGLEDTTKFSDDAVIATASLIQGIAKLPTDQLQRTTKAALDLATAFRIDVESAGRILAKASEGNVIALKKLGFQFQKGKTDAETFSNILSELETKVGGSSEESVNSFAGALAKLSNSFADVLKEVGNLIIQNPQVNKGVSNASDGFKILAEAIKDAKDETNFFIDAALRLAKIANQGVIGSLFDSDENGAKALRRVAERGQAKRGQTVGVPERGLGGPDPEGALMRQNEAVKRAKDLEEQAKKQREAEKKLAEARKKDADRQYSDILQRAEANRKVFNDQKGYGQENDARAAEAARVTQNSIDAEAKAKQQAQRDAVIGAVPGLIGNVGQGKAGVAGAAASALSLAGPQGAIAGAALQFLAQGPEAVRAQIQGFIDGVPEIITSISESIPVVVEVLAANAGKITTALSLQMPLVANTLAFELVKQSPNIALAFANSLINEAGRIAQAIGDAVKQVFNFGGGGSGVGALAGGALFGPVGALAGGVFGKKLGFAEGGMVPGGAPFVDKVPAMLTPQERVLNRGEVADLEVLNKKVDSLVMQVQRPTTANLNLQIGLDTIARAMVEIDRRGIRAKQI
jgi:hypothetical protein